MFNPFKVTHGILGIVVGIIRVLPGPLAKIFESVAFGFAAIWQTKAGKWILGGALVLALVDASWGSDPIYLFLFGPILTGMFLIAVGMVGAMYWSRRRAWEEKIEETIHVRVPGHNKARPARVHFSESGKGVQTGRWTGRWNFVFEVPDKVVQQDIPAIESGLRERLRAEVGSSWSFSWNLRRGVAWASIAEDLPELVRRDFVSPSQTDVPLGVNMSGVAYWSMDSNFGNMLVTGGPGGGKSVVVNNILRHCIEQGDSFAVMGIDLKGGVELGHISKYGPVQKVADDLDSALDLLDLIRFSLDKRLESLRANGVKKLDELNDILYQREENLQQRVVLLVDELAELTDVPEVPSRDPEQKAEDKKRAECKALLDSIVRLGRAAGIHVVVALQRPDVRYLGGAMRSNIQARVVTGRLDRAGAQMVESELAAELPGVPGRGVYWRGGQEEIVQYYFAADEDLDRAQGVAA